MMFGKEVVVKAKPAKTVVKAFAVAALKAQIWGCCGSRYSPVKDCVGKSTAIVTVFLLRLSFVDMEAKATVHDILSQPLSKRDALLLCMHACACMHVQLS